jgi:putative lipoic acid-binding regulatory protein
MKKKYNEKIIFFPTNFDIEKFKKTAQELNLTRVIGTIYTTKENNFTTLYMDSSENTYYNEIIIKGTNKKQVKDIYNKIKKEITEKQKELSHLALIG